MLSHKAVHPLSLKYMTFPVYPVQKWSLIKEERIQLLNKFLFLELFQSTSTSQSITRRKQPRKLQEKLCSNLYTGFPEATG